MAVIFFNKYSRLSVTATFEKVIRRLILDACFLKNNLLIKKCSMILSFKEIIRREAGRTAHDIMDAVYQALYRFGSGYKPEDDITLVIIKIEPMNADAASSAAGRNLPPKGRKT